MRAGATESVSGAMALARRQCQVSLFGSARSSYGHFAPDQLIGGFGVITISDCKPFFSVKKKHFSFAVGIVAILNNCNVL